MTRVPRYGETKYEILAALVTHWEKNAFGPTVEELREAVGLTVRSSVQWHINDLLRDKYVTRVPKKHRTLRPTRKGTKLVEIMKELQKAEL
jgi:SOS-response transcriptional repressor LexA